MSDRKAILVSTLVSATSQHGRVQLDFSEVTFHDGEKIQFDPEEARAVAFNILEAAEACEMESIVLRFLQEKVGLDLEDSVQVVGNFRSVRQRLLAERLGWNKDSGVKQ